ncbi:MAG: chemotaxis protein CheD [Clostridiales bacterium]|nr:chemotaxis protein CheD [Clostridiales bacterium]
MSKTVTVGISDLSIVRSPDILVTYALGSCVGICLYDKVIKVAGLAHIMLPSSLASSEDTLNRMKYADTAIVDMVKRMSIFGARQDRITAKIAGGAQMFAANSAIYNIGERNTKAVVEILQGLAIPIIASDTGKNYGRTVYFNADTGEVQVKSAIEGIKTI